MGNPLTIYKNIKAACYDGDFSSKRSEQIHTDIAALDVIAKGLMSASIGGFVFTYVISRVPYIGTLLGIVPFIASIASAIIGYDLQIAAKNLEEYANNRIINFGKTRVKAVIYRVPSKDAEEEFAKDLFQVATKDTLLIKTLYAIVIAQQHR